MLLFEEQPFVRQALHVHPTIKSSFRDFFKPLKSRDSRLFYILDGKGSIVIDGTIHILQPDSIFIFKAGTTYEWQLEWADYYVLNFDYSMAFSNISQTFHPLYSEAFRAEDCFDCGIIDDYKELNSPIVLYKAINLKHSIRNLVFESAISDLWSKQLLSSYLKQILLQILRAKSADAPKAHNITKQAIAYIQDHYNEPITNSSIAEKLGYNPVYLGRIFKENTGTSLHDYVIDLRIAAAADALKNSPLSISEIGRLAGMDDVYHFSKLFKQKVGLSPPQYRKQFW